MSRLNAKTAKRLRKQTGYHPSQETDLIKQEVFSRRGAFIIKVVDPESPKAVYKAMKKEYKNGNAA